MTDSESRRSSGSPVRRERWLWWLAMGLFLLALGLYAAVDRPELYDANFEWWTSVIRWLLGG